MSIASLRRQGGGLAAAALVAFLLAGCATMPTDTGARMRLDVRDGELRQAGSDCGGAGSLRYIHPTADYQIVAGDGTVVGAGRLPQGVAEKSFDADFGDLPEPTSCVMRFDVPGVSTLEGVFIRIDRHPDVAVLHVDDDLPTAVVP